MRSREPTGTVAAMSLLDRAKHAADQATQQASLLTDQARLLAGDGLIQERLRQSVQSVGLHARDAAAKTKRGITTLVDRIDPGLLAEIVIRATALQEKTNASLRAKHSPYRISEITITAAVPPQVGFSIGRVGEVDETPTGREIDSTELVAAEPEPSADEEEEPAEAEAEALVT